MSRCADLIRICWPRRKTESILSKGDGNNYGSLAADNVDRTVELEATAPEKINSDLEKLATQKKLCVALLLTAGMALTIVGAVKIFGPSDVEEHHVITEQNELDQHWNSSSISMAFFGSFSLGASISLFLNDLSCIKNDRPLATCPEAKYLCHSSALSIINFIVGVTLAMAALQFNSSVETRAGCLMSGGFLLGTAMGTLINWGFATLADNEEKNASEPNANILPLSNN